MQAQLNRTQWETIEGAVNDACTQGDYLSAETILRYAAQECDQLGKPDRRIVESLERLLRSCFEEKRYEDAERIYWLGLKVKQTAFGYGDPAVVENLDN